ncbi:MAG: helix-turn-helix domain-containing protein [Puniceicoccaceae bacterium]
MNTTATTWKVLNCRFHENPPPWRWHTFGRSHCNLWIASAGKGGFRLNGRSFAFDGGTAFLILPGDEVLAVGADDGRRVENFAAHFIPDSIDEALLAARDRINGRSFSRCLWLIPLLRDLSHDFSLLPGPGGGASGERLMAVVRLLATEPDRPTERRKDGLVAAVVEKIRNNPAASYSVPEMAAECGLSVSRFTRRFREMTGHPPNRFMVAERLRTAEMMLLGGNAPIGTIAGRLGYRDIYFFSRQFRRHRGVSPSEFRRGGVAPRPGSHD